MDFIPRFNRYRRQFRPVSIVRMVEPLRGVPRICMRLRPRHDYGEARRDDDARQQSLRYLLGPEVLRLTTDAPVSLILSETPFVLERPLTMVLGADEPVTDLSLIGVDWYEQTLEYWRDWTRQLALPFEWQEAVIRAAITLKLCSYEETGGIVAALTTSVPEFADSRAQLGLSLLLAARHILRGANAEPPQRDAHDGALHQLHHQHRDGLGRGSAAADLRHRSRDCARSSSELDQLAGYRGMGPVRIGNGAYDQIQNDGYGSVILAVAQSFFDQRLAGRRRRAVRAARAARRRSGAALDRA